MGWDFLQYGTSWQLEFEISQWGAFDIWRIFKVHPFIHVTWERSRSMHVFYKRSVLIRINSLLNHRINMFLWTGIEILFTLTPPPLCFKLGLDWWYRREREAILISSANSFFYHENWIHFYQMIMIFFQFHHHDDPVVIKHHSLVVWTYSSFDTGKLEHVFYDKCTAFCSSQVNYLFLRVMQ